MYFFPKNVLSVCPSIYIYKLRWQHFPSKQHSLETWSLLCPHCSCHWSLFLSSSEDCRILPSQNYHFNPSYQLYWRHRNMSKSVSTPAAWNPFTGPQFLGISWVLVMCQLVNNSRAMWTTRQPHKGTCIVYDGVHAFPLPFLSCFVLAKWFSMTSPRERVLKVQVSPHVS